MDAFGVFEGGGAKGLAHAGALKAAEESGVRFIGVAGTSAGSIVAALVAAGYVADELYKPAEPNCLFHNGFLDFFDPNEWKNIQSIRASANYYFPNGEYGWWSLVWFVCANWWRFHPLRDKGGLLSQATFRDWLDSQLRKKLQSNEPNFVPSGPSGTVAFQDLPTPLKIIAADVSSRKIRVFSQQSDAAFGVVDAVAASIAIPFVFFPSVMNTSTLVDGGILSNFPAWTFDDERRDLPAITPTFGFRLVETKAAAKRPKKFTLIDFALSVAYTAAFGDNTLETREVASLHEVPLRVGVGPLDFDMTQETKKNVYETAKADAAAYFDKKYVGPRSAEDMSSVLKTVQKLMLSVIPHDGHMRVNVMLPVRHDTLQVTYTYNMDGDDDYDDRMTLKRGVGAAGVCWDRLLPVLCDLEDARVSFANVWQMDKRQQRLVRASLKSLLSIPIFNPMLFPRDEKDLVGRRAAFIGVLNFDSDDRIIDRMGTEQTDGVSAMRSEVLDAAYGSAQLIAQALLRLKYRMS